jgi:hypothetical protein
MCDLCIYNPSSNPAISTIQLPGIFVLEIWLPVFSQWPPLWWAREFAWDPPVPRLSRHSAGGRTCKPVLSQRRPCWMQVGRENFPAGAHCHNWKNIDKIRNLEVSQQNKVIPMCILYTLLIIDLRIASARTEPQSFSVLEIGRARAFAVFRIPNSL